MTIWWCARFERAEHREEDIAYCQSDHIPVGEKCGPMRLIPDNEETVDLEALAKALAKPWPQHWEKNSIIAAAQAWLDGRRHG